jgi:hypothetical protein
MSNTELLEEIKKLRKTLKLCLDAMTNHDSTDRCGYAFLITTDIVNKTLSAIPSCKDCEKPTNAGPCPGCGVIVCQNCAEQEGEFCDCVTETRGT